MPVAAKDMKNTQEGIIPCFVTKYMKINIIEIKTCFVLLTKKRIINKRIMANIETTK